MEKLHVCATTQSTRETTPSPQYNSSAVPVSLHILEATKRGNAGRSGGRRSDFNFSRGWSFENPTSRVVVGDRCAEVEDLMGDQTDTPRPDRAKNRSGCLNVLCYYATIFAQRVQELDDTRSKLRHSSNASRIFLLTQRNKRAAGRVHRVAFRTKDQECYRDENSWGTGEGHRKIEKAKVSRAAFLATSGGCINNTGHPPNEPGHAAAHMEGKPSTLAPRASRTEFLDSIDKTDVSCSPHLDGIQSPAVFGTRGYLIKHGRGEVGEAKSTDEAICQGWQQQMSAEG